MTQSDGPRPEGHDWQTLAPRLARLGRALCGGANEQDAQDLVQETFARLLSRGEAPAYPYARRTMVRLWIDERRRSGRATARALRWALGRACQGDADTASEREDRSARVRSALERLSPQQRAAIVMRTVDDMSPREIAAALGTNDQTVRACLHTARRRMRDALGEQP